MKLLFLDDDRRRHRQFQRTHIGHDITYAFSYTEVCPILASVVFDEAYLDHDLTEGPIFDGKDGRDIAEFIVGLPLEQRPRKVIIHSLNEMRGLEMNRMLAAAGVSCMVWPFDELMLELSKEWAY